MNLLAFICKSPSLAFVLEKNLEQNTFKYFIIPSILNAANRKKNKNTSKA